MSTTAVTVRTGVRTVAMGILVIGAALLTSACSSSKSAGGGTSAASSGSTTTANALNTVVVKNFSFEPMSVTVKAGTRLTWKFEDSAQHTVSADDNSFASPALANGQTYSFTFTKPGIFQYICSIHQYMKGTVVVK
jgi:plastocyanin